MAGNNLAVKITADIADAQAKLSVLNAEFQQTQRQINALARAGAAGSLDSAGEQQLRGLAQRALELQAAAQPLAVSVQEAGFSIKGLGAAASSMGQSVEHSATGVRYLRELFDEFSSGRTRYLPSTLAAFAQTVLKMNIASLAAVGGVGALAAGLGYLAVRSIEAANAIDRMKVGADFVGNTDLTRAAIEKFIESLSKASNVSSADAAKIAGALVRVPGMTQQAFTAVQNLISQYMEASGSNAEKASEAFAKMLDPGESAAKAAASIKGVTAAQMEAAEAADRTGNANVVMAAKLDILESTVSRSATSMAAANSKTTSSWYNWFAGIGLANQGLDANRTMLAGNTAELEKNAAAVAKEVAALRTMPASPEQTLQLGVQVAGQENPIEKQMQDAKTAINEMTAALAIAQSRGDQVNVDLLTASIKKAEQELQRLRAEQTAGAQRAGMAELDAGQIALQADLQSLQQRRQAIDEWLSIVNAANHDASQSAAEAAQKQFQENSEWLKKQDQDAQRSARQQQQTWQSMVRGIESAESGFIRELLSGRESFGQAAKSLAERLAQNEITVAAKAVTQKILLKRAGAAEEKAISSELGAKTVMQDAAKAYSGAFSAVSGIPYVGPILAPIAGATAFAAVAAYQGMASLDVGAWNVPQDMVAQIHAGEMVVPATYAQGMRQNGGVGGESHHYHGNTTINAIDTQSVRRALMRNRSGVVAAGMRAYRRGAFSRV